VARPDDLRTKFHSVYGVGHATGIGYKNERLDELLELGWRTTDMGARKQIYHEAEQIILDDMVWTGIYWRASAEALAQYVKGYPVYPSALYKWTSPISSSLA